MSPAASEESSKKPYYELLQYDLPIGEGFFLVLITELFPSAVEHESLYPLNFVNLV